MIDTSTARSATSSEIEQQIVGIGVDVAARLPLLGA
jgi:hypothetical protein